MAKEEWAKVSNRKIIAGNDMGNKRKVLDVVKEKKVQIQDSAKDTVNAAKENVGVYANQAKDKARNAKNALDMYLYKPIMKEELESKDFDYPKIVRVVEKNKHVGKDVCKNAVAFVNIVAGHELLEIVKKDVPAKIMMKPNNNGEIYCRDPYEPLTYIGLDDYFNYIKKERVDELVKVANCLGAKHVKIVYKEEKKSFVSAGAQKGNNVKVKGKKSDVASEGDSVTVDIEKTDFKELEVAAELTMEGNPTPKRPKLVYYKNDTMVEDLIDMMMDGMNRPKSYSKMIKYSRTQDISINAAIEIDEILAKLSLKSNASVQSEVEKENRLYLEISMTF